MAHGQRHEVAFWPFDERLRIINELIKPQYALLRAAGLGVSAVV